MNLYQINSEIQEVLSYLIDEETGEINLTAELELEQLEKDKLMKVKNIGLAVKNFTAEAEAIRNEERNLAERRRSLERKSEWLKMYLLKNYDGKIEDANLVISIRKSKQLEIGPLCNDEELLRLNLATREIKYDKRAIKKYIQETGVNLEDIRLVEKENLQIK